MAQGRKKDSVSQKMSDLKGADSGKNREKVMKSAKLASSALGTTLRRKKATMMLPMKGREILTEAWRYVGRK